MDQEIKFVITKRCKDYLLDLDTKKKQPLWLIKLSNFYLKPNKDQNIDLKVVHQNSFVTILTMPTKMLYQTTFQKELALRNY
jgi:hypothetical protein